MAKKKKLKPEKKSASKNEGFTKEQVVNASAQELKQLVWGYKNNDTNFLSYECDRCKQCVSCFYCHSCTSCRDTWYSCDSEFLIDCSHMKSCSYAYKSSGHEDKSFVFCDIELSESEYNDAMNKLTRE